jgi:hypothetical protein
MWELLAKIKDKKIQSLITGIVIAAIAIYFMGDYLGLDLPVPALQQTVTALAAELRSEIKDNKLEILLMQFKALKGRYYASKHAEERYKGEDKPVPEWLLREQLELETQINEITNELIKLGYQV